MTVTHNITLDINRICAFGYIQAKQADSAQILKVRITADGVPINVPKAATVAIRAIKPNGNVIYNAGSVNNDGTVNVTIASFILSTVGKVYTDISIAYDNRIVSTSTFVILVEELPGDSSAVGNTGNNFTILTTLINYLNAYSDTLDGVDDQYANGPGITVELDEKNDILIVKEN